MKDLTVAGADVTKGEHVLAMYVARKNHEAIKSAKGIDVTRFWVGKKSPSKWSPSKDPLLVVGHPFGSYEGEAAQSILADFYLINAELGDKHYWVRFTLNGPGIKDAGIERNITDWVPALVWAASDGEHTLKAELIDPNGKLVEGRWNPTVRKFNVRSSP